MVDELQEISKRIVDARNRLDAINMTNRPHTPEMAIELEMQKAKAQIDLRRAKRDYEDYIQDEVAKP